MAAGAAKKYSRFIMLSGKPAAVTELPGSDKSVARSAKRGNNSRVI